MKSLQLFVVAMIWTNCALSQFTESQTLFSQIPLIREQEFGSGISVFDVDEDGWDDLTICSYNLPTRYFHNNQGQLVPTSSFPNSKNAKSCIWADLDNDGLNDLIVTRFNAPIQIFWQNAGFTFILDSLSLQSAFLPNNSPMGVAVGDFNRDALLDVMVANYSYSVGHRLFVNAGNRNFNLGAYGNINYTNTLAFQPTFIDLTNDNYPELYLVNDHEAPCELYQYDPSSDQFNNLATAYGLTIPSDAMSNSWSDFDNDGDFDVYVSNGTNLENHLMVNQGDTFTSVGIAQNLVFNLEAWGGLWIDIDNDGWQDLVICTREGYYHNLPNNKIYKNNHGILTEIPGLAIQDYYLGYFTAAKGDFNNDGSSDMIMSAETNPQLSPSVNAGQNLGFLGINTGRKYIKFKLNGRWSNRNGIGTRFTIHTGEFVQTGFSMAGEIYLAQQSQNILFGVNQATTIDSIVLHWPSGLTDTYYNLPTNNTYNFTEGETHNFITVTTPDCFETSYALEVNTFDLVNWSNGDADSLTSTTDSIISAFCNTGFGNTVELPIELAPIIPPSVVTVTTPTPCSEVALGSFESVVFQNEMDTLSWIASDSLQVGNYLIHHEFGNGCVFDTLIEVIPDYVYTFQNPIIIGTCPDAQTGTLSVSVSNGAPTIFQSIQNTLTFEQLGSGPMEVSYTDSVGCGISETFTIPLFDVPELSITLSELPNAAVQAVVQSTLDSCTFQWQDNSTNDTLVYVPQPSGDYLEVMGVSPQGCQSSTSVFYLMLEEFTSDLVEVQGRRIINRSGRLMQDVRFYNEVGQLILASRNWPSDTAIELSNGFYLLVWDKNQSLKVMIRE